MRKRIETSYISTEQFKDITISLRFIQDIEAKRVATLELLTYMMGDRLKAYPSKARLSAKLDELYGLKMSVIRNNYGRKSVVDVRFTFVHPKYIEDDTYRADVVSFMKEAIYRPLLDEKGLVEAKQMTLTRMKSLLDYPQQYVVYEGLKEFGEGTPLEHILMNDFSMLEGMTLQDIQQEHQNLLTDATLDIFLCGEYSESLQNDVVNMFDDVDIEVEDEISYYYEAKSKEERSRVQHKDISQSYFSIVYDTGMTPGDPMFSALSIAVSMLGSFPTSLLFQEVREKRSLCYSISSMLMESDGAMLITSGMEDKNVEEAIKVIDEQLIKLQEGTFEDSLLDTTKRMILNSAKSGFDTPAGRISKQFAQKMMKRDMSFEAQQKRIQAVTKEDIMKASLYLRKSYTLYLRKETTHA